MSVTSSSDSGHSKLFPAQVRAHPTGPGFFLTGKCNLGHSAQARSGTLQQTSMGAGSWSTPPAPHALRLGVGLAHHHGTALLAWATEISKLPGFRLPAGAEGWQIRPRRILTTATAPPWEALRTPGLALGLQFNSGVPRYRRQPGTMQNKTRFHVSARLAQANSSSHGQVSDKRNNSSGSYLPLPQLAPRASLPRILLQDWAHLTFSLSSQGWAAIQGA